MTLSKANRLNEINIIPTFSSTNGNLNSKANRLNDINTCLKSAEEILSAIEALSVDMPHDKKTDHKLNLIIDQFREFLLFDMHELNQKIQSE